MKILIKGKFRIAVSILLFLISASSNAYVDTIIALDDSGNMIGLPEKYTPSKISLESGSIQVGSTLFEMPPCISKHFSGVELKSIRVLSSWCHGGTRLPPYISFTVPTAEKGETIRVLLALDNLKILKIYKTIEMNEKSSRMRQVNIDEQCNVELRASYKDLVR